MEIFVFLVPGLFVFVVVLVLVIRKSRKNPAIEMVLPEIPSKWRAILKRKVVFYRQLSEVKRLQFESDVQRFLRAIRITGVETEVTLEDRLLVASSAVIPLFGFPAWTYKHLDEVLLYPAAFDRNYSLNNPAEWITGMVGNGPMEGKVILSKPALHLGFDNERDKKNVGIHEFVHLFDKATGQIDGLPPGYEDKAFSVPWVQLVQEKIVDIISNDAKDINDYGATNPQEFFAVASEYFFERPHLLERKHPKLYQMLSEVFNQDPRAVIDASATTKAEQPKRNGACPCGSGKKYKHCCIN